MRIRLIIAIGAVVLLLIALQFGEGSYKPFHKLEESELASAVLTLGKQAPTEISSPQAISRCVLAMHEISVLFTGSPDGDALAELEATFAGGEKTTITLYENAIDLDGKSYSLSPTESAALLTLFENII